MATTKIPDKAKVAKLPLVGQIRQITETNGRAPFITCPLCKHTQVAVITAEELPVGALVAGGVLVGSGVFLDRHDVPDPARVIQNDPNVELYVSIQCPASGAQLHRANVEITRR